MKKKILATLMATSFALAGASAIKTNDTMEINSNFNIVSEIPLKQNSLEKSELNLFDYYGSAGMPFNYWSFSQVDLYGDMLSSDFWCGWLGDLDSSSNNFGENIVFDYIDSKNMVKVLYDDNGNVFAVAIMEYTSNLFGEYDNLNSEYNLDKFSTQELSEVWRSLDNVPLRFNLYMSQFAGKGIKFNAQDYSSYINSSTQKDISFLVAGILGYDNGFGSVDYTNEELKLYVNPNCYNLNTLDKTISVRPNNQIANQLHLCYEPIYEFLTWTMRIGYESRDDDYPSINGVATYYFSVDTAKSFDYIKSTITAYDETEGDITHKIQFTNTDNYTLDNLELKTYNFKASVSDEAGHKTSQDFKIVIKDVTAPTISGMNREASYTTCLTAEEVKALFTYSDNYDVTNDLTFTIISDNYTAHYNEVANHQITARVTDKSGNSSEATATISVVDKIAPILSCSTSYRVSTIASRNLTLDKLVTSLGIVANDVIDGSVSVSLTDIDSYSNNMGKAGSYTIRATASDSRGNTSTTEFELEVYDGDYPVISVNSPYCIIVQEGEVITESIIKNILISSGQITEDEAKTLHIESSALRMNSIESGSYIVKLLFDSGMEDTVMLQVNEPEEKVETNDFKDTIKNQISSAIDNITNINEWNWFNWTMVATGLFIIVLVILVIKKRVRK